MAIVLFDPPAARSLYPLTYTRAAAGLRIGILTIQARWQLLLGEEVYVDTATYLQPLYSPVPEAVHTFINALVTPGETLINSIKQLKQGEVLEDENGIIACKGHGSSLQHAIDDSATLFTTIEQVQRLQYPHQLFQWNENFIESDFKLITAGRKSFALSSANAVVLPQNVFIEEGAQVEYAVINAAGGPVYIGKNATIMEGCLIRGPMALCEGATLKMGTRIYGATTIGPYCVAGGEIKNVIMQGYSNKGHDGYLGDSVIGEWCNIGAGASNSNVKNTAGDVMQWNDHAEGYINAGSKCGVIMGDYSRVAINSSINTGSMYGVCCNVFGEGLLPKRLRNFSWGTGEEYDLLKALEHITEWKKMKGQALTDEEKAALKHIFETF